MEVFSSAYPLVLAFLRLGYVGPFALALQTVFPLDILIGMKLFFRDLVSDPILLAVAFTLLTVIVISAAQFASS